MFYTGQYLDHDITLTAHQVTSCKNSCHNLTKECYGIFIPADDPHFPKLGVSCIALKKDVPAPRSDLAAPRYRTNILSAFIDASQVYGVNEKTLESLKDIVKGAGLLKEIPHPSGSLFHGLFPPSTGFCRSEDLESRPCFKARDGSVDVNAGKLYTA